MTLSPAISCAKLAHAPANAGKLRRIEAIAHASGHGSDDRRERDRRHDDARPHATACARAPLAPLVAQVLGMHGRTRRIDAAEAYARTAKLLELESCRLDRTI